MQKSIENKDFNKTVGPCIGKTYKMMSIFICDQFLKNDIQVTKEQWIVLKILHEQNKSICQNELAFITNRNKTTLTRLINVMEKNQLVERSTSKKDGRKKIILITDKGEELFLKMKPIMFQIMNILQKGISNEEMEALLKITNKIQDNIKNQSL